MSDRPHLKFSGGFGLRLESGTSGNCEPQLQKAGIVKQALLPGIRLEALCRHSGSNECKPWADSRMWRRHRIIIEL